MQFRLSMLGLMVATGSAVAATPATTVAGTTTGTAALIPQNQAFQEFDDQFYVGYGTNYGNLTNGFGQNSNYGTTFLALGVERLFDLGIWLRVDASLMTGYSNFNSSNLNAVTGPLGQDPSVANLNLKLGYALQPVAEHLLVTPYLLVGRNTNLTSNSLTNNQATVNGIQYLNSNVTQDYFLTGGFGGRVEYRLNHWAEFYLDEALVYNQDNSAPTVNYAPANNFQTMTQLGAKVNIWQQLQLGMAGFYGYAHNTAGFSQDQQYQLYPQNQIGVMASLGLTY